MGRARGTFRGLEPGTSTRAAPGAHPQAVEKVAQSRISRIFHPFPHANRDGGEAWGQRGRKAPRGDELQMGRDGDSTQPARGTAASRDRHGPRRHTLTPHTPGPADGCVSRAKAGRSSRGARCRLPPCRPMNGPH